MRYQNYQVSQLVSGRLIWCDIKFYFYVIAPMTDNEGNSKENSENDGGDAGRKKEDEEGKYNLKVFIRHLKKEQSHNVKVRAIVREQHSDRIIGEMIQYTVENLNWEYSKIEGGRNVRPGRGWISTAAIIIGINYIYQDFDIEGIEAKYLDIMRRGDFYDKQEVKSQYHSIGSFPINNYLNESERGKISKISELTGYESSKVKGLLFSLGVVKEEALSDRERTAYNFESEGLTGQLPRRFHTIEGVWSKLVDNGSIIKKE